MEDLDVVYVKTTSDGKAFINADNGDLLVNEHYLPVVADKRTKQHLGLFSVVYFFSTLHNLLAQELREKCYNLPGSVVFQKARAINIALYQRIFYDYILGVFVGDDKVEEHQLSSYFDTFDDYQEPEILSEYACAAGRACHKFTPGK